MGVPLAAQAFPSSCWVLTDLMGKSSYQSNAYQLKSVEMGYPITIRFEGDQSSTGAANMTTKQIDDYMVISFANSDTVTTVEVYQVDPTAGIATYTQSMAVKGYLSKLSGATMMVSKAVRCK